MAGDSAAADADARRRTALVVEDSPTMRQMLRIALRRIPGLKVVEAGDGVEALRRLDEGVRPDVILTDINMPEMDGLRLVKWLQGNLAWGDVPIVIITTEDNVDDRDRALALGARAYVTKPLRAPDIVATVRAVLGYSEKIARRR
jgi:two-component system chemotaxis response regulator CheY